MWYRLFWVVERQQGPFPSRQETPKLLVWLSIVANHVVDVVVLGSTACTLRILLRSRKLFQSASSFEHLTFRYTLFFLRDILFIPVVIHGWLNLDVDILVGTCLLIAVLMASFVSFHKSFTVRDDSNLERTWIWNFWRSSRIPSMSLFSTWIFRWVGRLFGVMILESTCPIVSWSLIPGIGLHFATKDGRFIRKRSSV